MRRNPLFFACASLELARYFTLVTVVEPFMTTSTPQLIRLVAAPNILFAVAFFFLGMDAKAYASYRPLLLVGKAMALFAGGISLPSLFGNALSSSSQKTATIIIAAIVIWDIVSAALIAFLPLKSSAPPQSAAISDGSPDSMEIY